MSLELLGAVRIGDTAPDLDDVRAGKATIRKGAKGDAVEWVQKRVGVDTDGDFGAKTDAAVRAFQRSKGLSPDGVVGKDTVAELEKVPVGVTGAIKKLFTSDEPKPVMAETPAAEDRPKPKDISDLGKGLIIGAVVCVVGGVVLTLAQDY